MTETSGGRLDQPDDPRVEGHGLEARQAAAGDAHPFRSGGLVDERLDSPLGLAQQLVVGVSQIDRQLGLPRHDVDQVRAQAQVADRRHLRRTQLLGEPPYEGGDRSRCVTGIVAHGHGRRTCMVGLALDRQLLPRDPLDALDHADVDTARLEDRALLDVQLDVGVRGGPRTWVGPRVADALQLVADARAVDAADVKCRLRGAFRRRR